MRLLMVMAVAAVLNGCGDFEWFPANNGQTTGQQSPPEIIERTEAGGFIDSSRGVDTPRWVTRTERGVFATYTSLSVPVQTPVVLEKHFDATTGLPLGKLLQSNGKTVLVDSIISLEP
jgi:hypothetical protein